jgi:NAD(P)-dependent dehydrogenase (short-subunit alcohol dehydrogenase family)
MNIFDLKNKVAVITGSTRGIGRSIAEHMAYAGAKVVISSRTAADCEAVAQAIKKQGGEAIAVPASISKFPELQTLVQKTRDAWGKIDILVCNAASNPHFGSMMDLPDEMFDKTMRNNILSNLWLCKLVAPEMRSRKDGAIIIVSSIGGLRATSVLGVYALSKAADMQLARNLALEFGKDNVRVNCIAPGLVKTDFAKALWENPKLLAEREAGTPLKRIGEPDDIGGIAVMLASRAGAFITGQTIVADGGVTIA